jgi:hypothetical protein
VVAGFRFKMSLEEAELDESGGDEDEGEIIDWQLPLCFMKKRHRECIEGAQPLAQTWRMKERVCSGVFCFRFDVVVLLYKMTCEKTYYELRIVSELWWFV